MACIVVAVLSGAGLAAYLLLHFFEPSLAITWSYAHLGRRAALPWIALALVLVLPPLALWGTTRPSARRSLDPIPWHWVLGSVLVLWPLFTAIGLAYPNGQVSIDPVDLLSNVDKGTLGNTRWYLMLLVLGNMWKVVRPLFGTVDAFLRCFNALMGATALLLLAASARRLGRDRGEAIAITLLAWSAFGVAQLTMGYLEIYPSILAITALYLWTGLGTVRGELHPTWPMLVATVGSFWYVGLILLGPSLVVIAAIELRRRRGVPRLALAATISVIAAGIVTVPGFGPFAWSAYLAAVHHDLHGGYGLAETGSLLPADFMLSCVHLREMFHTVLLIDGVGVLLLLVTSGWALMSRAVDAPVLFLASVAASFLPYLVTVDPVWGALGDWDLFSYAAAITSVLGGYLLVLWGRECPRLFAVVLGLALAASGVHLLARWNAMTVDYQRHLLESPFHVRVR